MLCRPGQGAVTVGAAPAPPCLPAGAGEAGSALGLVAAAHGELQQRGWWPPGPSLSQGMVTYEK